MMHLHVVLGSEGSLQFCSFKKVSENLPTNHVVWYCYP